MPGAQFLESLNAKDFSISKVPMVLPAISSTHICEFRYGPRCQLPMRPVAGDISIFKTPKEMIKVYPHLSQFGETEAGVTVSAPIKYRNTVLGAIGFTSLKPPQSNFMKSETTQGVLALCGLYIRNLLANRATNTKDYSAGMKTLSTRQKQIINLFKEDLTTDQMAERLKYSSSTIKQDIIKIYSVFGVNSRSAVVELAKKAGLS